MAHLKLDIVTFNGNESAAIERLFDDILTTPSSWNRKGRDSIELRMGLTYTVRHLPLRAQGNVVAAARLAESFPGGSTSDFVLFYGCAGALDPSNVGHAYLVKQASYASLGTVANRRGATIPNEEVTLKNKWLCHTHPHDVDPLQAINFSSAQQNALYDLVSTWIDVAHVVATDKVIKVAAAKAAPQPFQSGPPHAIYAKGEWTYSDTLAFVQQQCDMPVLVEMESFGIGMVAKALKCDQRVVIIRVVTDDLVTHGTSDAQQASLLLRGRIVVASLLKAIVKHSEGM